MDKILKEFLLFLTFFLLLELKKKNASGKYEVIDTQTNDADGKVTFRTLKYEYDPVAGKNDIGDHEYTISEVKPEPKAGDNVSEDGKTINGITYDDKVVEVKVNVKDNEDGTMTLTYNGEKEFAGAEFTNTYSAKGNGEIKVQKLLEGRDWTDNDSFTFTLTGVSAPEGVQTVPMPANKSITIKKSDKDQTRSFGEIEFTKAGTYTYTVKETKGAAGGVTYDEKEHTVTFKAVDDGKGRIVADQGSQMIQTEKITNTYSAAGCVGSILVQKSLKGREWKDDDEFEFTLTGENGAPMPDEDTITITKDDKDHIAGFGNITFTKAGKYTYTVKETKGDAKGVTYDTKKHKVTIEVIDDGNGKLVAKSGTDLIQTVKITNTYSSGGIKTGDSSPIVLYSIITVTALILLLIAMFVRRRQNRAE